MTLRARIARYAVILLAAIAAAYGTAVTAIWVDQERLLFEPEPIDLAEPLARDPDVRERFVDVPGARLSVLELRLADPRGVVLFLHGNRGNVRTWFVDLDKYRRANFDLVMPDYRGFGKSSGRIASEAQLHDDVLAVWRDVAQRYRGRRVVVYGRSLGSGLAVELAATIRPDLTILVSPYASMAEVARLHYPWVPGGLLRYPLRTDQRIAALREPVLLLHGDRDRLIPPAHSERLQGLARNASRVVVPGAGHGNLHESEVFRRALDGALAALR